MKSLNIEGLVAAPHTPMHGDGAVKLETIDTQAEVLAGAGVRGAFVCGTTGEGLSLTVDERMRVAERWQAACRGRLLVIVHVAHTCIADCKALAAHAQKIGADAIGAMGPCFFRPDCVDDLVAYCSEVAAAAPELPFYYYHIPKMSGVHLPMAEFLAGAAEGIPTLGGMKYTHDDLYDFGRCLQVAGGRCDMLFGRDEMLLGALAIGARGAVGSTYNYAAPLYLGLIEAYKAGDTAAARAAQARARDFVAVFRKFGGVRAGKAIMKMIGIDCGPVRLPLRSLDDEERRALRGELERIGFFEYCLKA